MISAIVSREFGYGIVISEDALNKVNACRHNKSYLEKVAATNRAGNAIKKPLTCDPFVIEFEYGSNGEAYWNYEAISMQFEDCIYCMAVLYPEYETVVLFDHSYGHDRKRSDGLNLNGLSKGYGGKQQQMRSSVIIQKEGYLGQYTHLVNMLQIGSSQYIVFNEDDTDLIYLTVVERISKRYDKGTW